MLVLVTGGTGYVGSHSVAALIKSGHRVRILARSPRSITAALAPLPKPPYEHPVFVLTHRPRDPITMEGGTVFHFVTDGAAVGVCGVAAIQQFLRAGLVDELASRDLADPVGVLARKPRRKPNPRTSASRVPPLWWSTRIPRARVRRRAQDARLAAAPRQRLFVR